MFEDRGRQQVVGRSKFSHLVNILHQAATVLLGARADTLLTSENL